MVVRLADPRPIRTAGPGRGQGDRLDQGQPWGRSLGGYLQSVQGRHVMAFNTANKRKVKASPGPLATEAVPTGQTGNGAPGYAYEDKSALFLLATNSFFGQKKFYESAKAGDDRFVVLVRKITQVDPVWMLEFITWLRASGNMRAGAVVASVEAALVAPANPDKAPSATGRPRGLARAGIGRADEIGEAMAYFQATYPGKSLPKPLKRGLADALVDLVHE